MQRSALLAALVAATAAIGLALGAAALGPALADGGDDPATTEVPEDPPDTDEQDRSGGSGTGDSDDAALPCPGCDALDLHSQVAALLPAVDPRFLLGALGVGIIGLAVTGLRERTGDAPERDERESAGTEAAWDRARDAGLEPGGDVAPTNDVYRAWLALSDAVDAPGATTSPRALCERAVEAGFDPEAVDSVTRQFEAVRYGTASATPERERRAREALETLEGVDLPAEPPAEDPPQATVGASDGLNAANDGDR